MNNNDNPVACASYAWRHHNPGRIMSQALRRFEERVMALMSQAGHVDTRRSHVNLTRHLDLEGTRITELARRAAMTNAAMTELIDQCVQLGLVQRVSDPSDGRARIVVFTDAGRVWLDAFGQAVETAQREMTEEIQPLAMSQLLAALARYGQADESA